MATGFAQAFSRTDRRPMAMWWWTVDRATMVMVASLIIVGLLFSFSSSPVAAAKIGAHSPIYFTQRHILFAVAAISVMMAISMLSLKGVKRVSAAIYSVSILIMILLPFIGHTSKGGQRWLNLGFFKLQPSEFLKPALIILIAWMFAEGQKGKGVPGVTIAFCLYVLAVALLLIQPDVGQSLLITIAFGACFFISGVPVRWIVGLGASVMAALVGLFFVQPHFRNRIMGFINPDGDKYQVNAGLSAISNGGLWGQGINEGTQKRFIPDLHTDFIYSVIGEEAGLFWSLAIILVFGVIVIRGLIKAMSMSDPFRQIATSGLYIMLGTQVFINISVNLGVIPPKGMTLPFISYGGSSLLAMGLTMGFILALTRKRSGELPVNDDKDPTKW
ncbi:FtsW/RodA/SpoVE family cell cycle protein [Asticcacaulis endophyticus]|uniref:Probable peptidoglycan glycosyltransferase FtsW n=1 Tax=Asticcacaulis endophyticus TaxID=1395890 RepID=A0A918Q1P9_9CAUL|nr:putative peptidoglycan glycosyltransferase FtsW [Asticcacaulis endophyticus]GGZ28735.1 putative lipid II flippase FtsW [Asticcacaulis endophyticus]